MSESEWFSAPWGSHHHCRADLTIAYVCLRANEPEMLPSMSDESEWFSPWGSHHQMPCWSDDSLCLPSSQWTRNASFNVRRVWMIFTMRMSPPMPCWSDDSLCLPSSQWTRNACFMYSSPRSYGTAHTYCDLHCVPPAVWSHCHHQCDDRLLRVPFEPFMLLY